MARTNAEAAAKAAGQTDEQAKAIGDQAEAAAKTALGLVTRFQAETPIIETADPIGLAVFRCVQ